MVKDTILYDELNISPTADDNQIKKAYRKLSMKWHPDKNQDNIEEATSKFQKISEAYSILSNKEKRSMYDQVGIDMLKNGGEGPSIDPSTIFEQFFGGGFGGGGFPGGFPFGNMGGQQRQREDHCIVEQEVSLEDIYNGNNITINYQQKIYCKDCDGTGCKNKRKSICKDCNGKGKKIQIRQMGPMVQQFVTNCNSCNGTGEVIEPNNKCQSCNGKGFTIKNKSLNIPLKKELSEGSQIRLSGKGHNLKSGKTALIIVIKEKPHSTFKRINNDLHLEMEIPLYQDIYGFSRTVTHLDNRKLLVKNDKMLKGEGIMMIHNEGMYSQNGIRGNLYIHIKTKYPSLESLEENEADVLRKLLIKLNYNDYKQESKINKSECYQVNGKVIDKNYFNYQQEQEAYENEHQGENVQCAQH